MDVIDYCSPCDSVAGTAPAQSMQAGLQKQAVPNLGKIARVQEGEIDALVSLLQCTCICVYTARQNTILQHFYQILSV